MKKIIFTSFAFLLLGMFFMACGTTASVEPAPAPVEEPQEQVKEEPVAEQEPEVVEEPEVIEVIETEEDKEYERSTSNVSVSKETFNEDKERILLIIKDLDTYMRNKDFKGWLKYLDDDSKQYWSKKQNLQALSQKMKEAKKNAPLLRLETIEDYFKFYFIPARVGKRIDEIRYDTETEVNAVQVNADKDIVYYNFNKVNDKWKLVIPKIHN